MRMLLIPVFFTAMLSLFASCGEEDEKITDTVPGCLGSVYPDRTVIDPDDPDFADGSHTAEEVRQMFAQAKADSSNAYWAYTFAFDHPDLIQCAFCSCGCAISSGHLSAVDCYKDLHGFG